MPSFFYHIALDLRKNPSFHSNSPYLIQESSRRPDPTSEHENSALKLFKTFGRPSDIQLYRKSIANSSKTKTAPKEASSTTTDYSLAGEAPSSEEEHDYRYGKIMTVGIKMAPATMPAVAERSPNDGRVFTKGVRNTGSGLATKGQYKALEDSEKELGWGIVRLYRDGEETPGLYDDMNHGRISRQTRTSPSEETPAFKDEDCTTLCLLAVPSYLTPSDFLGFVGEKTREKVSHFRMIRTEQSNRYMVLMKFRNGKEARIWRKEWNGRSFNGVQVGISSCLES